jgi:hypothetical protein
MSERLSFSKVKEKLTKPSSWRKKPETPPEPTRTEFTPLKLNESSFEESFSFKKVNDELKNNHGWSLPPDNEGASSSKPKSTPPEINQSSSKESLSKSLDKKLELVQEKKLELFNKKLELSREEMELVNKIIDKKMKLKELLEKKMEELPPNNEALSETNSTLTLDQHKPETESLNSQPQTSRSEKEWVEKATLKTIEKATLKTGVSNKPNFTHINKDNLPKSQTASLEEEFSEEESVEEVTLKATKATKATPKSIFIKSQAGQPETYTHQPAQQTELNAEEVTDRLDAWLSELPPEELSELPEERELKTIYEESEVEELPEKNEPEITAIPQINWSTETVPNNIENTQNFLPSGIKEVTIRDPLHKRNSLVKSLLRSKGNLRRLFKNNKTPAPTR